MGLILHTYSGFVEEKGSLGLSEGTGKYSIGRMGLTDEEKGR